MPVIKKFISSAKWFHRKRFRILYLWLRASLIYIEIVQLDATQSSLFFILRVHSTCLGCQPHPSSTWPSWPRWREVAAQKIRPVPEAVVTVLCTRDYGCG